jgi:hypothetical protein
MYISVLRAFFFSTISSGVKNDKTIPPWFGSWLASFISPYSFASSPFDDFAFVQDHTIIISTHTDIK